MPRKTDDCWANVQPFQVRGIDATQVIEILNKNFGEGNYQVELQDPTTWVLRSNRKLTPVRCYPDLLPASAQNAELKQLAQNQEQLREFESQTLGRPFLDDDNGDEDEYEHVIINNSADKTRGSRTTGGYESVNVGGNRIYHTGSATTHHRTVDLSGITIAKSPSPAPTRSREPSHNPPPTSNIDNTHPPGFPKPKRTGTMNSFKEFGSGIIRRFSGLFQGPKE